MCVLQQQNIIHDLHCWHIPCGIGYKNSHAFSNIRFSISSYTNISVLWRDTCAYNHTNALIWYIYTILYTNFSFICAYKTVYTCTNNIWNSILYCVGLCGVPGKHSTIGTSSRQSKNTRCRAKVQPANGPIWNTTISVRSGALNRMVVFVDGAAINFYKKLCTVV